MAKISKNDVEDVLRAYHRVIKSIYFNNDVPSDFSDLEITLMVMDCIEHPEEFDTDDD